MAQVAIAIGIQRRLQGQRRDRPAQGFGGGIGALGRLGKGETAPRPGGRSRALGQLFELMGREGGTPGYRLDGAEQRYPHRFSR